MKTHKIFTVTVAYQVVCWLFFLPIVGYHKRFCSCLKSMFSYFSFFFSLRHWATLLTYFSPFAPQKVKRAYTGQNVSVLYSNEIKIFEILLSFDCTTNIYFQLKLYVTQIQNTRKRGNINKHWKGFQWLAAVITSLAELPNPWDPILTLCLIAVARHSFLATATRCFVWQTKCFRVDILKMAAYRRQRIMLRLP